jgi:MarR family transcriptional regulator, 2-MHQ and catechol-resistance regulon repressor
MVKTNYKGSKDEVRALNAYVKLMRASESMTARIHRHLVPNGLTITQFGTLEALYSLGPLNQKEIARKILKSSGNITLVIDNLEKRGLVKRERSKEDRRSYAVDLTAAGRKLIGTIFPRHAAKILEEMKALTGPEQEELSRLCRKMGLKGEASEG